MSDEAKVLTEVRGRTLVITMNRPEARNAVNGDVASGIEAAIDELENNEELWTAVLTGNGPVFCAGADLKAISSGNAAGLQTERGGFGGFVQRKRTKPVIAALNGPALAGGCELAISCDLIVAPEGGKIGIPEVKRSLIALAGGLVRLPRLLDAAVPNADVSPADWWDLGLLWRELHQPRRTPGMYAHYGRMASASRSAPT